MTALHPWHWVCVVCNRALGHEDVDLYNSPDGIRLCCPNDVGGAEHRLVVMLGALPESEPPSIRKLALRAELWNALTSRVTHRTGRKALFSVRDRLARQAVVELDRLTDVWLAERGFVVNKCEQCGGTGTTVAHRGPADESDLRFCPRCEGTGRGPIIDSRGPTLVDSITEAFTGAPFGFNEPEVPGS